MSLIKISSHILKIFDVNLSDFGLAETGSVDRNSTEGDLHSKIFPLVLKLKKMVFQ